MVAICSGSKVASQNFLWSILMAQHVSSDFAADISATFRSRIGSLNFQCSSHCYAEQVWSLVRVLQPNFVAIVVRRGLRAPPQNRVLALSRSFLGVPIFNAQFSKFICCRRMKLYLLSAKLAFALLSEQVWWLVRFSNQTLWPLWSVVAFVLQTSRSSPAGFCLFLIDRAFRRA